MFLSTNSLCIVYTFSWEFISISSHIVVCPLFNITSVHKPERNICKDMDTTVLPPAMGK